MIMVQLARLKLQHVLTALARQCTVESVRRWVSETYNMLISNSHMQWVLLSAWYWHCNICWLYWRVSAPLSRWVSETYNMLISTSHLQWMLLSAWYCSQLGFCLICWVWSCWVPLGTTTIDLNSRCLWKWPELSDSYVSINKNNKSLLRKLPRNFYSNLIYGLRRDHHLLAQAGGLSFDPRGGNLGSAWLCFG